MRNEEFCIEEMRNNDKLRVNKAVYKERDTSKRKRKLLRARRKKKGDQAKQNEGEVYAPGSF